MAPSLGRRVLRLFLYQRELTPILITVALFVYFAIRAGSNFTGSLSLSSAAGYAGPIGAIAVGEVLLLVLAEIDLSAGQVFLFAPWVEYWLHNDGVPVVLAILLALVVVLRRRSDQRADHGVPERAVVRHDARDELHPLRAVLIGSNEAQANADPAVGVLPESSFAGQIMGVWQWAEILWVIGITIVVTVMLTRTRFGVRIIATGGNLSARPRRACRSGA